MPFRRPVARSASLGESATVPLTTSTPPTPTGLPSPSTPTSSSSYSSDGTIPISSSSHSSDGTQSTIQQTTQSLTNPSSSPTTPGQAPSVSISTTISSSSDATSTNYKGSGPSTDMPKSPSSQSPMSTGEGGQTNGSSSGSGITTLSPNGSDGGTSSQISPTTSGPVISSSLSNSLGDPSLSLPTSLLSPPTPTSIPLSLTPTSIPLPSVPPTTGLPTILSGQQTTTQSSSLTTLSTVGNPTTAFTSSLSVDEPSATTDTYLTSTLSGKQTSSYQSTSPTLGNPSTSSTDAGGSSKQISSSSSSSTHSDSATSPSPEPTVTSQTTAATSAPMTSSQEGPLPSLLSSILQPLTTHETHQSTQSSATTSTTSTGNSKLPWSSIGLPLPITPLTTDSQTGTWTTTIPQSLKTHSSDSPAAMTPTSSQTYFSESLSTTLPTTFFGGLPTTVPGAKSSLTLQSPSGRLTDTSSTTVHGATVPPAGLPTTSGVQSSGDPVGDPSSTAQGTTATTSPPLPTESPPQILDGQSSTTTPLPVPSGETLSSITHTSTSVYLTTFVIPSGTGSETLTSAVTSTSLIVTTTPVPSSGTRSIEAPVIGGVVGGVLALLLLGIAACHLVRRRRHLRAQQRLYDRDLTAPLSTAEAMRENHPYRPTYTPLVGGQVASESRGNLHHALDSLGSSAFPHPSITPSSPHHFARDSSGSVLYENNRESNDGDVSSDDGSEGTERYFGGAQSFYRDASMNGELGVTGGVGIAIGSQSSMDIQSYHTAATTLDAGAQAIVDDDEESESPGPSPSSFPVPPTMNPFFDGARVVDLPDFVASRASQNREAVSVSSEGARPVKIRTFLEQQASWTVVVVAASPIDTPTPIANQSLHALIDDGYNVDTLNQDLETPTQSRPPVTPFSDLSYIVNPFLPETSQEGFSDESGGSDSHETVSEIPYANPFESWDKGKGKEQLSADLEDDPRRNRLSNASSGLEFPENASQCGIAL